MKDHTQVLDDKKNELLDSSRETFSILVKCRMRRPFLLSHLGWRLGEEVLFRAGLLEHYVPMWTCQETYRTPDPVGVSLCLALSYSMSRKTVFPAVFCQERLHFPAAPDSFWVQMQKPTLPVVGI